MCIRDRSVALGLEALSRGAKIAYFGENSHQAAKVIEKNIYKTKMQDKAKLIIKDYKKVLEEVKQIKFDIIFLDPQYETNYDIDKIELVLKDNLLKDNGFIVLETDSNEKENKIKTLNIKIDDTRKSVSYTHLDVYKRQIYDFRGVCGIVDESHPQYGLYRFKKGFGAEFTEFIGEIYIPFKPITYKLDVYKRQMQAKAAKTIAVLGSGLDNIYPPENKILYENIIKTGGTIVSEYVIGTKPIGNNFPRRNRIISGMAKSLIVIEAKIKSGTFITDVYKRQVQYHLD